MGLGDFLQGAGGGALAGAGLGGGPFGALVGGALGGIAGLFGGNQQDAFRGRLNSLDQQFAGRAAPQAGPAAQAGLSSFRDNQQGLVNRLEAMAAGQGPSLAQAQLQAATDRNVKQQQALAAGARGPNAAMAQFQAANNAAQLGAQAAQDAGAARIAEQQMALQQLGLALHGARGQDEDMGRFNAGQQNDVMLANLQAQLQGRGQNDLARLQLLQMLGGMSGGPSLAEQILAGGASLYNFGATQRAQSRAGSGGQSGPSIYGTQYGPLA